MPTARRTRRWKVSSSSGRMTKRIVSGIQKPCSLHAEQPVDGDAGGERGAEAERVAEAGRAQGQVGRAGPRSAARRVPAARLPPPLRDRRRPRRRARRPPAAGRRPWRRAAPAGRRRGDRKRPWAISSESATERPAIASRSETRSSSRPPRRPRPSPAPPAGADWPLRTPSAAAIPISGAAAACQAARGRAGASSPGKPASRAPVAIAPLVGASKPQLDQQREADRDRDQGAAPQRRPGLARPDREQRRGPQPPRRAAGVEAVRVDALGSAGTPRLRVT